MTPKLVNWLSCEFLLRNRPNGGGVIVLRSLLVTVFLYLAAIGIKERLHPDATWSFDATRFRVAVADTLPWFGAIFAATYAAFYSRFSAQWSYLANLYNQIMQIQSEAYLEERRARAAHQQGAHDSGVTLAADPYDRDTLAMWVITPSPEGDGFFSGDACLSPTTLPPAGPIRASQARRLGVRLEAVSRQALGYLGSNPVDRRQPPGPAV